MYIREIHTPVCKKIYTYFSREINCTFLYDLQTCVHAHESYICIGQFDGSRCNIFFNLHIKHHEKLYRLFTAISLYSRSYKRGHDSLKNNAPLPGSYVVVFSHKMINSLQHFSDKISSFHC